jgi:ubiquitin carboxyl-terminal hydrolase 9/24
VLSGDNAYKCVRCDAKVSTLRRMVIQKLPPTLVLMLKRFEMSYESFQSIKINDRLEFPTQLNMFPFTLEGVQQHEAGGGAHQHHDGAASASAVPNGVATSSNAAVPLHPPEYYQYVLRGVVVHSGTVAGGHYYSYIQDRAAEPGSGQGWFEFNDKVRVVANRTEAAIMQPYLL